MNARKNVRLFGSALVACAAQMLCLMALVPGLAAAAPPNPFPPVIPQMRTPPPVIVVPATILPANVTPVPGMCSAYDAGILSTGAIGANGTRHPGNCRATDLDTLFEGVPLAQYWQGVTAGTTPPPYTVTLASGATPGSVCAKVSGFSVHLSARVLTSAMGWTPNRPAGSVCAAQWTQHDPLQLVSPAALQSQVANFLSQYATQISKTLAEASPIQECAVQQKIDPRLATLAAQRLLAAKIGQLLTLLDNQQPARWAAARGQFEGPATQGMCAMHCNVCDAAGWSGTIVMSETIDSTAPNVTYHHAETDTFYVGGAPPAGSAQTVVPFDWTAVGSGTATNLSGGKNWTVNATAPGSCVPQPPGGCILVLSQGGMLKFSGENSPFTVQAGTTLTQTSNGASSTATYGASETQIPPITAPVGATSVVGQTTLHPAVCYGPMVASPYVCTQQWSWNLSYH